MNTSIIYGATNRTFNATGLYVLPTNGLLCNDNISIITNGMKLKASYGGNVIFNVGTAGKIILPVANKKMTSDIILNFTPMQVDIMLSYFQYSLGFNKSNALKNITFV